MSPHSDDHSRERDWITVILWSLAGLALASGAALLFTHQAEGIGSNLPAGTTIEPASRISPSGEIDLSRLGVQMDPSAVGETESDRPGVSIAAYGP